MLNIKTIKYERPRDIKRKRLMLSIGTLQFRITRKEALDLRNKLNRFNLTN